MLTRIWLGFFIVSAIAGFYQWFGAGDALVFQRMVTALFEMAELSVELALGLIGLMAFWLGVMALGQASGLIDAMAKLLSPLFSRLMPDVPRGDPAVGSVTMNLAANVLGLDNAATPLGIKAMGDLQRLNPTPDTATNAQILFLVLNTSSVTLFPVTVLLYRAQLGASDPAAIFVPILLATFCSTLVGLVVTARVQRLPLSDSVVLAYFATAGALVLALIAWAANLSAQALQAQSSLLGNLLLFSVILLFLTVAWWRKVDVYATFVEGAKQGFETAIMIIPYLLAMLVAIGVFRASGALDTLLDGVRFLVGVLGGDTRWVEGLPTALMKPLSGSGARAMMVETMNQHGVDSFAGRLSAVLQGSTETTFYVLAVYFGAAGIRNTRHAVPCALAADLAGITAAIVVTYWYFG